MSLTLSKAERSPFPGLRPFQAEDAAWFFGREAHIKEIIRKLWEFRFVSVVGNSGSGKSSLLRAGVIPQLKSEAVSLKVLVFRPGHDPVRELAQAILRIGEQKHELSEEALYHMLQQHEFGLVEAMRLLFPDYGNGFLFLVDQFEEVFRFQQKDFNNTEAHPAQHFVRLILAASRQQDIPLYIMLTLRSDFMGDCEQLTGLPEAINDGQFLVPRLKPEELKLSIEGPVRKAGLRINPELVERLVREARHNPDQLPVLQHVLMRTWEVWKEEGKADRPIDFVHYNKTGGVTEALSRHAEEAYAELNEEEKKGCALLFKSLTVQGSGERGVRRPQSVQQLSQITGLSIDRIQHILAGFRDIRRGFLMPPGVNALTEDTVVDISHESLMRVWTRLGQWVEEEAESAGFYLRLVENARLYDQGLAGLWRDPDLQLAINWRETQNPKHAWAEQYQTGLDRALSFIEASELLKVQMLADKERQLKQRRALVLIALVILGILSIWALFERFNAQKNAQLATQQRDRAVSQEKATAQAKAQAENNLQLAVTNQKKADQQRLEALKQKEEAIKQRAIAQKNAIDAAIQRDAAQQATVLAEKEKAEAIRSRKVAEQERENAEAQRQLAEQAERASRKMRLLALSKNLAVQSRLAVEGSFPAEHLKPAIALAAWKMHLANGGDPDDRDFYLSLLSAQRWVCPPVFYQEKTAGKSILNLAFTDDGSRLISASEDGLLRYHDAHKPGLVLDSWSSKGLIIKQILINAEGKNLLVLLQNNRIVPFRLEANKLIPLASFALNEKAVALASLGAQQFAVVGMNQITLWSWGKNTTPVFVRTLIKDPKIEWSAAYGINGQLLLGAADGRIARIKEDGNVNFEKIKLKNRILSIYSTGNYWAAGSSKGEAVLVKGENSWWLNGHEAGISQIVINGPARKLATSSFDGKVRFWSLDRPEDPPISLQEHSGWVSCLAIAPQGDYLASGSRDRSLRTYAIDTKLLADLVQRSLSKPLSRQEWIRYLGPDVDYAP